MWNNSYETFNGTVLKLCQRRGDADILGLGVRLGIYLSTAGLMIQSTLARSAKDPKPLLDSSLPLAIALATVLSQQASAASVHDFAFLCGMYVLCVHWAGTGMVLFPYMIVCCRKHGLPGWSAFAGCLLSLWVLIMQMWFWAVGYQTLHQPACGPTYAFFFGQRDIAGWMRTLGMVVIGVTMVFAGPTYLLLAVVASRGGVRKLWMVFSGNRKGLRKDKAWEAVPRRFIGPWMVYCTCISTPSIAVIIVGAELTIVYNGIKGLDTVTGTGQTMALITGLASLLMAVYSAIVHVMSRGDDAAAAAADVNSSSTTMPETNAQCDREAV